MVTEAANSNLRVVVVAVDPEQRKLLGLAVQGTGIARATHTIAYPANASDLLIRQVQDEADVLLVDIPSELPIPALHAIELFRSELPRIAVCAIGDVTQPQLILAAMRAGAQEFLPRPAQTAALLEAFSRLSSTQRRQHSHSRAKLFAVIDAKGGCGATTVAVNLSVSLQGLQGATALVDLASLGHAAIHLNVKPAFTLMDAMNNAQRLDAALLEGYMTRSASGVHLLAGMKEPLLVLPEPAAFARLFEILANQYTYIVVDCSTRYDAASRLVCEVADTVLLVAHADVTCLWSAAQVRNFLQEAGCRDKIRLVLNRYRKIGGFNDNDVEALTGAKVCWKLPNEYQLVAAGIDRGLPVAARNHSELASSFVGLAAELSGVNVTAKRRGLARLGLRG